VPLFHVYVCTQTIKLIHRTGKQRRSTKTNKKKFICLFSFQSCNRRRHSFGGRSTLYGQFSQTLVSACDSEPSAELLSISLQSVIACVRLSTERGKKYVGSVYCEFVNSQRRSSSVARCRRYSCWTASARVSDMLRRSRSDTRGSSMHAHRAPKS
jgi:hypothetical protein